VSKAVAVVASAERRGQLCVAMRAHKAGSGQAACIPRGRAGAVALQDLREVRFEARPHDRGVPRPVPPVRARTVREQPVNHLRLVAVGSIRRV
jgi:hypothetical protein